jgi:hypothetical protein
MHKTMGHVRQNPQTFVVNVTVMRAIRLTVLTFKNMKHFVSIAAILVFTYLKTFAGTIDEFNSHFRLLPQPQKVELLKDKGIKYSDLRNVVLVNTKKNR